LRERILLLSVVAVFIGMVFIIIVP